MLTVSLSQVQGFRQCEMAYWYRYVAGLRPKEPFAPIELGSLIHKYLEEYYNELKRGCGQKSAHAAARDGVMTEWQPKLEELATTAYMIGAEETSEELRKLADTAQYLIERYYVMRGQDDAERYQIERVEQPLRMKVAWGINSLGVADLVVVERQSGLRYLFEHKTTRSVPSMGHRLRDIQTVLYAEQLEKLYGGRIDAVLWNYCRTATPAVPERLKSGGLSRRAIDTTWDVYKKAVVSAGEDPLAYADVQEKLAGKEAESWFPRQEFLLHGERDIVLRDYTATAKRIAESRRAWAKGAQPVRNISRNCDWCSFNRLCTAALQFDDDREVRQTYFTTRQQRKAEEYGELE